MTATIQEDRSCGMIDVTIQGTAEAVAEAVSRYQRRYPSLGYNTRFDAPSQRSDGDFAAHGSRYSSCD